MISQNVSDRIKTLGSGFVVLLLLCSSTVCGFLCTHGEIACKHPHKCIPMRYICDGDNDCGDRSDEGFCSYWNQSYCERGEAKCRGSCVPMENYCKQEAQKRCTSTSVDPRICQMLKNRRLESLESIVLQPTSAPNDQPEEDNLQKSERMGKRFADTLNVTLYHPECPQMYTRVGEHCLSLFYILKVGWGEARAFCEAIDGQIISFPNEGKHFMALTKYLQDNELTVEFWIGGRYSKKTESWKWVTGESMELGSPFWAVRYNNICLQRGMNAVPYWLNKTACYHYQQAPKSDTDDMCVAITYRHYYYMSDENCLEPKSPLCLYNGSSVSSTLAPTLLSSLN